jgi:hypothetical protein
VIQLILDDYPEAARLMASNGEAPLHVARPRSEDTLTERLKHLIGAAPGALHVVDHDADNTPLNTLLRSLKRCRETTVGLQLMVDDAPARALAEL